MITTWTIAVDWDRNGNFTDANDDVTAGSPRWSGCWGMGGSFTSLLLHAYLILPGMIPMPSLPHQQWQGSRAIAPEDDEHIGEPPFTGIARGCRPKAH